MNIIHNKKMRNWIGILLVPLFAAGCATTFKSESLSASEGVLNDIGTYAWVRVPYDLNSSRDIFANPINARLVREAADKTLASKGYRKVPAEQADVILSHRLDARETQTVRQYYGSNGFNYYGFHRGFSRFGGSRFGGLRNTSIQVTNRTDTTLVLDVFDNHNKEAIWHGRTEKRLTKKDRKMAPIVLQSAVDSILEEFPDAQDMVAMMESMSEV